MESDKKNDIKRASGGGFSSGQRVVNDGISASKKSDMEKIGDGISASKKSDVEKIGEGISVSKKSDMEKIGDGISASNKSKVDEIDEGISASKKSDMEKIGEGISALEQSEVEENFTVVNMNVDGMKGYVGEEQQRRVSEIRRLNLSKKEKRAIFWGGFAAIFPLIFLIFGAFGLAALFCWWWLG